MDFRLRRTIISAFLGAILLIGVPMWVLTTSIYRAPLNYDLMDKYDKQISQFVKVKVPVCLSNIGEYKFPDLVQSTQFKIDTELKELGVTEWGIKVLDGKEGRQNAEEYIVELQRADDDQFAVSERERAISIGYTEELIATSKIPDLLAGVLLDHVFGEELKLLKENTKLVQYSPKYHLTFSLFTSGNDLVEWDIASALKEHFTPLRASLSDRVANFTIDTQVQHYSDLAFDIPEDGILTHDQLSTFVNFGEWSLTSIHSYPTLHFILYVSQDKHLKVEGSMSNAFSIPQWGGVVIRELPSDGKFTSDDLLPILETFSQQLLHLLGAPNEPANPLMRIDALSRISSVRALHSASATLGSLRRLSASLPNIAIPSPVQDAVEDTFLALQQSLEMLKTAQWRNAVVNAGIALTRSENAFFDKMMVQQMFFPEEHRIAIYLPLLGPMAVVLFLGTRRIIQEFKEERKKKVE